MLGTELAMIPGVPLKDIRMSPYADGVVLVEQEIDSTLVIQLFQRRAEEAGAEYGARGGSQGLRRRAAAPGWGGRIGPHAAPRAGSECRSHGSRSPGSGLR